MSAISREDHDFKRAVIFSVSVHLFLFLLFIISPYLPKPARRGMVHYVNLVQFGGGGNGGGGGGGGSMQAAGGSRRTTEERLEETPVKPRETLRDLTTAQRLREQTPPSMTYPVEKPARSKPKPEKKQAVISRSDTPTKKSGTPASKSGTAQEGSGSGPGLGIGMGDGSGGGGFGFGPGFGDGLGISSHPFGFYLETLRGKIQSNWTKQTQISGQYFTEIGFKIFRNGSISEPEIRKRSGIRALDLTAVRAVRNCSFPPLPNDYEDEYMGIILVFQHGK